MRRLRIIPYEACHAWQIVRREEDNEFYEHPKYYQWSRTNQMSGPAVTCVFKNVIVCCFGIRLFWEGSGEVWAIFCRDIRKYARAHYYVRFYLEETIEEYNLTRVQARARTDFPEAIRYLEYLGFERECLMRKFGPSRKDYYSYVRIR